MSSKCTNSIWMNYAQSAPQILKLGMYKTVNLWCTQSVPWQINQYWARNVHTVCWWIACGARCKLTNVNTPKCAFFFSTYNSRLKSHVQRRAYDTRMQPNSDSSWSSILIKCLKKSLNIKPWTRCQSHQ